MNFFFYSLEKDFEFQIAKNLLARKVNINTISGEKNYFRDKKSIEFINGKNFYDLEFLSKCMTQSKLNDMNFLHQMKSKQWIFNLCLDRVSLIKLSANEIDGYYRNLVYYCYKILNEKKISTIFFSRTPHFPWDLVIYYVSKYLNIKNLILFRTEFDDKYIIKNCFEGNLKNWVKINNPHQVQLNIQSFVNNDSVYIKKSKIINNENDGFFYFLFRTLKLLLKVLIFNNYQCSSFMLKKPNRVTIAYKIIYRFVQNYYLLFIYNYLSHKEITTSSKKKFEKNLIYFPLHFQPERSTLPEGEIFTDQLLAIKFLSSILPKNWLIIVKEHPRQFDKNRVDLRRINFRSAKFYNEIASINNVRLCKLNQDSDKIINDSKIICTITGTSGFEGLKKLKPVITFGNPWYSACKNVKNIKEIIVNQNTLSRIFNLKKIQLKKNLEDFSNLITDYLIPYHNPIIKKIPNKKKKIIINEFCENLINLL